MNGTKHQRYTVTETGMMKHEFKYATLTGKMIGWAMEIHQALVRK